MRGGRSRRLGGHNDLPRFPSSVLTQGLRAKDQPLVEKDPTTPPVYRIGSPADMMEMARREKPPDLHAAPALERIDRLS